VVDVTGLPLATLVVSESTHESRADELLLERLTATGQRRRLGVVLVGKGIPARYAQRLSRVFDLDVLLRAPPGMTGMSTLRSTSPAGPSSRHSTFRRNPWPPNTRSCRHQQAAGKSPPPPCTTSSTGAPGRNRKSTSGWWTSTRQPKFRAAGQGGNWCTSKGIHAVR